MCREVGLILRSLIIKYPDAEVVIASSTARGADTLGEHYAKEHGYCVKRFLADWGLYGKQAGFVRNHEMLDYAREQIGVLAAFWDGYSRGTRSMIEISRKAKLDVNVICF